MFALIHNPVRKVYACLPKGHPCHLAKEDSSSLKWQGQECMLGGSELGSWGALYGWALFAPSSCRHFP